MLIDFCIIGLKKIVGKSRKMFWIIALSYNFILSAGYDEERQLLMSQKSLEKRFGQSPVFIAATFQEQGGIPPTTNPATLLKEAIHVISCGYEDKTEWGKEVGLNNSLCLHLQNMPS